MLDSKKTSKEIRSLFLNYFKSLGHEVVKSSSLIPHNDPSLMFINAGMNQFKDYFLGKRTPPCLSVTSCQKCVRAGGKHNDLENVGVTKRHHTFFEMLGNFSFGEYFKEQAILYAWNFLTKELSIDQTKMLVTYYHEDRETYELWKSITGFEDDRLIAIDSKDNFWQMGDEGLCGPCTEIFFDYGPEYEGVKPGEGDSGDRYIEIWNIVFMQYNRTSDGNLEPLPKICIDTGMGLERITSLMNGVNDNYYTDIFIPLTKQIDDILGSKNDKIASRVIADHLRSASFLMADGRFPSNTSSGYVIRRIIRRAVRFYYQAGHRQPLLNSVLPTLLDMMSDVYPELKRAEKVIFNILEFEESSFLHTLDRGIVIFNDELSLVRNKKSNLFAGDVAFKLYDTYGFPLEVTKDLLAGTDINVDEESFQNELLKQKKRGKQSWQGSKEQAYDDVWFEVLNIVKKATEFHGYEHHEMQSKVLAIVSENGEIVSNVNSGNCHIILDRTVFYGESGGQIGDTGIISNDNFICEVYDTKKVISDIIIHLCTVKSGSVNTGNNINAKINSDRRYGLAAAHSATHILHKSLRDRLGAHVMQKGSYVGEDRLRFDFSHGMPLSDNEIKIIKDSVNKEIQSGYYVINQIMPTQDAIDSGVMALFGEKYADNSRVITMGSSKELCGGTHVTNTRDILLFEIIYEKSVAAGIRRIEAYVRNKAVKYVFEQQQDQALKIKNLQDEKIRIQKNYEQQMLNFIKKFLDNIPTEVMKIQGEDIHIMFIEDMDCNLIKKVILDNKKRPIIYFVKNDGHYQSSCVIPENHKLQANEIIKKICTHFNAKGGGTKIVAHTSKFQMKKISREILEKFL